MQHTIKCQWHRYHNRAKCYNYSLYATHLGGVIYLQAWLPILTGAELSQFIVKGEQLLV